MSPPNAISIVRVLLVPVVMLLVLARFEGHERWAAAVYAIAAASDSLDGYLARTRGWVTVAGTFLDPLADKLLVSGALVALVQVNRVSAWVAMVVIGREFAVTGLRMVAAAEQEVVGASQLGKLKTFSQNAAVVALLLVAPPSVWVDVLLGVAVALTVVSLVDYAARMGRHLLGTSVP